MPYRGGQLADLFPDDDEIQHFALRVALRAQRRLKDLVTEYTPVSADPFRQFPGRLPGTLKRSWEFGPVVVGGQRVRATVETFDPVAPHVEWDTAPHHIRPRPERVAKAAAQGRRAMLRFFRETGEMVFAGEVFHPGTSGAHMMARALDQLEVEWPLIARDEWAATMRRGGRVRG